MAVCIETPVEIVDIPTTATIEPDPNPAPEPDDPTTSSRKGIGGPKTPEGKARSARNALKHGLRAETHIPDELAALAETRAREFAADLQPATPYQAWMVRRAGLAAARLDRIEQLRTEALRERITRAETSWDDDRELAVEELAARLPRDPARVAAALRATRHGVAWLIARWEDLGAVLARRGGWDAAQRRLALDLMGTLPELRAASPLDDDTATPAELGRLVETNVKTLRADLETTTPTDRRERRLARQGIFRDDDAPTRALRRYESEALRALNGALREFRRAASGTASQTPPPPPPPRARTHGGSSVRPTLAPTLASAVPNPARNAGGERPRTAEGVTTQSGNRDNPPNELEADSLEAEIAELMRREQLVAPVRAKILGAGGLGMGLTPPEPPPSRAPGSRRAVRP